MLFESFHSIDWVLLGALLALFMGQVGYYLCTMYDVRCTKEDVRCTMYDVQCTKEPGVSDKVTMYNVQRSEELPGVSVLVCAHNEAYNLSAYLYALLSQDYPKYEVIVVDDGSEDKTREVIESYMVQDKRLRITFVPKEARVRSTKKLALTLAAKAAQYDYLLLTDADCTPESTHWISEMMRGFMSCTKDDVQCTKEIVLGFGAYFYEKGFVNRLVRYDTLFNGLHYLSAAAHGHPYMGVGRNLAYKKELFFKTGGFKKMMNNRAGDDDLFVNHVANRKNTAVVSSRASITWSPAKTTMRDWWQQKRRHLSVSHDYRLGTKIRLASEPMSRGLFYLAVIALLVAFACQPIVGSPLSILAAMALGLFLLRWIVQTIIINLSAKRMGLHGFNMFTILGMDIFLPLVSLYMLCVPKKQVKW
ncbi:MAG: glycosyltransferase [Paludibacteraceae bacterium]|nr:glycosyltransferase [Paludibacteraceae bacterium]